MFLSMTCLGGYRERETPGPIPNPEAKPLIADNTAPVRCGNVGRRLVLGFNPQQKLHKQSLLINFITSIPAALSAHSLRSFAPSYATLSIKNMPLGIFFIAYPSSRITINSNFPNTLFTLQILLPI